MLKLFIGGFIISMAFFSLAYGEPSWSRCLADQTLSAASASTVSALNGARIAAVVCNTGTNLVRCTINGTAAASTGIPLPSQYDCVDFADRQGNDFTVSCYSTAGSTVAVCESFVR